MLFLYWKREDNKLTEISTKKEKEKRNLLELGYFGKHAILIIYIVSLKREYLLWHEKSWVMQREISVPGCITSGIERTPDALMRRFKDPYFLVMDLADSWYMIFT